MELYACWCSSVHKNSAFLLEILCNGWSSICNLGKNIARYETLPIKLKLTLGSRSRQFVNGFCAVTERSNALLVFANYNFKTHIDHFGAKQFCFWWRDFQTLICKSLENCLQMSVMVVYGFWKYYDVIHNTDGKVIYTAWLKYSINVLLKRGRTQA